MLKRNNILLFFLIIFVFNLSSNDEDYYSVNRIISFFKLETHYDSIFGKLTIIKGEKEVIILENKSYIYFGKNKRLLDDFIISDQGQFFIPINNAIEVANYFSFGQYKYSINNGDIYIINYEMGKDEIEISFDKKDNTIKEDIGRENNNDKKNNKAEKKEKIKNQNLIKAIIIDPGHGGKDPGAVGYNGIKEKDVVLRCALLLKEKLENEYKFKKTILTRSNDKFIELEDRAKIANNVQSEYGQSIFVSIHVNASRSKKSYGFETWYLVNNYTRKIVKNGELSEDKDVENVINSMLNEEIYKESKYLAKKIQNRLENKIGNVSKNRGIKEEIYFVIKKSIMPAVLVEIGFNTNKYEAIRLTNYSYLDKISEGISDGIKDFITEYEKTSGFSK